MLNSRDIISRLLKEGWTQPKGRGKGRHRIFQKIEEFEEDGEIKRRTRRVTISAPAKDFPIGTLKSIYKQAGWDWDL